MPARRIFSVRWKKEAGAWFVRTKEFGKDIEVAGPFKKVEAIAYARDRAKNLGIPTQVKLYDKVKQRIQTEWTYPRSSDPRKTKGTSRRSR